MRELPTGTVTFLFTDVEASTSLLHELGTERYGEALAEHRRVLREAFAAHGGVEVDTQGDAFFVAFGRASEARAAAEAAQRALLATSVRVRMGLHTGEPTVTGEGYVGMDVHKAARIAAVGHGGQILLSEQAARLMDSAPLRDLGEHRLKDLARAERIFQLGEGEFPRLTSLNTVALPTTAGPLIGREREVGEVLELLRGTRLLTLTGTGGIGKTRVALEVAASLVDDFAAGVTFVPLASIGEPGLVLPTITQAVGARDDLERHLQGKELLLLLDNAEHLLGAAPELARLRDAAPGLTLLVTSRAPLHVSGEIEYALEPMPDSEAVELFAARARAVRRDVRADDPALPEICRRLDGLPLALELAAARTRTLDPAALLPRLERRLDLLTGGARDAPERHRTLEATIDWSYDLLDADAQALFARLAVFGGTFSVDAAETVADADLDALEHLVELSLLKPIEGGRFLMLATIREYAGTRLAASGADDESRRRHAEFYAAFAAELSRPVRMGERQAVDRVALEHDNLRAAFDWALARKEIQAAERMLRVLWVFWLMRGFAAEGDRRARALADLLTVDSNQSALSLALIGELARYTGDLDGAIELKERAAAMFERISPDPQMYAACLTDLAHVLADRGELERASGLAEAAMEIRVKQVSMPFGLPHARMALVHIAMVRRDLERAADLAALAVAEYREIGVGPDTAQALIALARIRRDIGDLDGARVALREAAAVSRSGADDAMSAATIGAVAALLVREREPLEAARLYGSSDAWLDASGFLLNDLPPDDEPRGELERQLAADELSAASAEGARWELYDALDRALEKLS